MISTPGGDIYSAEELVAQGFTGYRGWSNPEAGYNFKETKGAGKGGPTTTGPQTTESIAQSIIDANKKQIEDETSYLKKYELENPFVFDEVFARESAKQEYEPYYQRLLQDYLSGVDLQRKSTQEEGKLLQDLYKLDTTSRTNLYDRAIQSAGEGAAGRGMFFSGTTKRAIGEKTTDYGLAQQGAETKFEYGKGVLGRRGEALSLEEQMKRRDIGEETTTAIEGGILKRYGEKEKAYYTARDIPYYRQFPTSTGSALRGYDIPEYLRY